MLIIKKFIPIFLRKILKRIYLSNLRAISLISQVFGLNSYGRVTNSIKVSIFGSCRQDSIARNFKVTQIRDGLTYPHYTKEIIQAINYVKSKGRICPKNLAVFRNIQLGRKLLSKNSLYKQFNATDLFVVEIASRISYEFDGDYYHHVIHDNSEVNSDLRFGKLQVRKRIQTDIEIQADMQTIKNLLAPKPVLFVTHFCTYESGERAKLRNLIVSEAMKMGSRVFDPSSLLRNYPLKRLTIEEPIVNHFSEFAHEVLSGRYQLIILEEIMLQKKVGEPIYIDQVLDSTPSREKSIGLHGFADCSFGSIFLYRYAISRGRIPRVNIENYYLQKYLDNVNRNTPIEFNNVEYIFHNDDVKKFKSLSYVYTNKKPVNKWDNRMRDFFLVNLLTPNYFIKEELSEIKTQLKLKVNYSSLHIRFGDDVCKYNGIGNSRLEGKLLVFLDELINSYSPTNECLILSDSEYFNKALISKGFKSRKGPVGNRGILGELDKFQYYSIIDFILLSESSCINHISYSNRVSGFSELASIISDIPLVHDFKLSQTLKKVL